MSKSNNFELSPYKSDDYVRTDVSGDGDCAYHSIIKSIKQLYPEINIPENGRQLRKHLLKSLEENKNLFPNDVLLEKNEHKQKETISRIKLGITDLGNIDSWAQNEELAIISNLYIICISIWSVAFGMWIYVIPKSVDDNNRALQGCLKIVYLYNDGNKVTDYENSSAGVHFQYLIPKAQLSNNKSLNKTSSSQDNASVDSIESIEEEDEDKVNKADIEFIKTASVTKKFKYFKEKIEEFNKSKNFETEISTILNTANAMKKGVKRHRLAEHSEYHIDHSTNINPSNQFFYTKKQKFLKKFLSIDTNNTAILLFHDVGVGKTCSSILIAENFVNIFDKEVLVLLPSSLENNYKKELFDINKLNYKNRSYDACSGQRFLDNLPDWYKLSKHEVNKKVQSMIKDDYSFYGYTKIVNVIEKIKEKTLKLYPNNRSLRLQHEFWTIRETFSDRVIVIDEIHNIRISNDRSLKKFPKVLKMILKYSENVRLILLSATPMFDKPEEFSWLMDFIYMADKQYKSFDTSIEFDNKNHLTNNSLNNLKYFGKNYVSYMSGYNPETFPVKYFIHEPIKSEYSPKLDMLTREPLEYELEYEETEFRFIASKMKGYQLKTYKEYTKKSTGSDTNIRQAIQLSNIVFPNETSEVIYGQNGFLQNFKMHDKEKQVSFKYIKNDNEFLNYKKNLSKYSSKMYDILSNIQNCNGLVLVYSRYLFSGVVSLGIALEHIGFKKYKSNNLLRQNGSKGQIIGSYIMITGDERFSPNNAMELEAFNNDENTRGSDIKVALINDIAAEGVTFKNVREIHILEPWYNMYKIQQIIGRGVRFMSHTKLPKQERNVGIYMYINTNKDEIETIDYRRYRHALHKQSKIQQIEKSLKSNSLDCTLNSNSSQDLNIDIIDSKGDSKSVSFNTEHIDCKDTVSTPSNEYNKRMIILDIIELGKKIKYIIETEKLYDISFDSIFKKLNENKLVKTTLDYMIRNKMIIILNDVQGYLIKLASDNDKYVFQPLSVDDFKISMHDRKKNPKSYIKRYLIDSEEQSVADNDDKVTETNIENKILHLFNEYKTSLFDKEDSYDADILMDMVVDHWLTINNIKQILFLKNEDILKSLERGHILLENRTVIFNFFKKQSICINNNQFEQCGIKHNTELIKTIVTSMTGPRNDFLGFIDILKKEHTVSKIKHRDPNRKSSGSACYTTSTFKVPVLQDLIKLIDPSIKLKSTNKKNLCLLYEYVLRKKDMFLRPVEYSLQKN